MRTLTIALLTAFSVAHSVRLHAADDYKLGPDSMVQPGVPQGVITKFTNWHSKILTNTVRDWWIYVPAQYQSNRPACVMVFQDGHDYIALKGGWRVPTVFDNLISRKEMPVTIGIFINPGHQTGAPAAKPWRESNRSLEYDSLGDLYAKFIIDEILPEVGKSYNLTKDPEGRAICGISSGGICAWTVAWERPDQFRKVLSHVGSFTNIRGGHHCQAMIRKADKKPIRVFLQAGANDLDNAHGNWPLANQEMAASLKFKGYDYKFEFGTGGHNSKHGAAILPDSLRWLWRDDRP